MYQKEIVYMNLFENEMKVSCVGYLKLERIQENYNIELQVKNVPNMFMGNFPIRLQGENDWKEADALTIKGGSGKWVGSMSERVSRAEVILTDSYRIRGESKCVKQMENDVVIVRNERSEDNAKARGDGRSEGNAEIRGYRHSEDNDNTGIREDRHHGNNTAVREDRWQGNNTEVREDRQSENSKEVREHKRSEDNTEIREYKSPQKNIRVAENTSQPETPPLYESKWEQLLSTYEQIHPYGDSRLYIKLEPKDFIVLRSNYQHLVNNSFLLHGFYNYRYVILGKEKDFYIGVPGVFYEREKMVALMFGFEAFECEGGNAEEGKFGYYLRKVEI